MAAGCWPCNLHCHHISLHGRRRAVPCSSAVTVARWAIRHSRDPPPSQDASILLNLNKDLEDYCATQDFQNKQECDVLQQWYVEKALETLDKSEPHTHPEPSNGPGSPSVEEVAQELRQHFRELALSGSIKEIYGALMCIKHLEEQKAVGHIATVCIPELTIPLPVTSDPEGRSLLVALFNRADTDHNGRLTWQEFQDALSFINDDLMDEELELVSSALDLQGSVTLDQFLAIVEQAECDRSLGTCDATFLRHMRHHHPSHLDHIVKLDATLD